MCGKAEDKRPMEHISEYDKLHMEVRTADSVVFYWRKPPANLDTVLFYKFFYKDIHPDSVWQLCKDSIAPSNNPSTTIKRRHIKSNSTKFYFSVRYQTASGVLSEMHTSTDSTSGLNTGWFMVWEREP